VLAWLIASSPEKPPPAAQRPHKEPKFPKIPNLEEYHQDPEDHFWDAFPNFSLPYGLKPIIKADRLRILINRYSKDWSAYEKTVAKRALKIITKGAISFTSNNPPPIRCKKHRICFFHGKEMTDIIAQWVDAKIVAGPFKNPLLTNFRSNALMAVVQPSKIRPILNLSAPKNFSLNDCLDTAKIPKIYMSTAKDFSHAIYGAGFNAKLYKFDLVNAYKTIAAHPSAWRLHGFKWLNRYFVDITTIFGSKAAPAHFDCIGLTLVLIAISMSRLPRNNVFRTLDDTPVVTPANSSLGIKFAKSYKKICKFVNIGLAPNDPKKEKAFENSTSRIILGVQFNTQNLSWSLPKTKEIELQNLIY